MLSFGEGADFGWLVQTSDSFFYGEEVLSFEEGEYCFSLFFLWIFWGKQKKSGFWGESGFFYWGFGGIQAVKSVYFPAFPIAYWIEICYTGDTAFHTV